MDTNERNVVARKFYAKEGYREAGCLSARSQSMQPRCDNTTQGANPMIDKIALIYIRDRKVHHDLGSG